MSAGLLNLGMGLDFAPQRQDSTAIVDPNYAGLLQAAQGNAAGAQAAIEAQRAAVPVPTSPTDYLNGLLNQQAHSFVDKYNADAAAGGYANDGSINYDSYFNSLKENVTPFANKGTLNQAYGMFDSGLAQQYENYAGNKQAGWADYGHDGAYTGLQANYGQQMQGFNQQSAQAAAAADAQAAQLKAERDAFQTNQNTQQDAYNKQNGGGFAGGILNSSYAKPFSDQIGQGQTGVSASSPAVMGAGSAAAPSTGLAPTGPAVASGAPGGPSGFGAPSGPQQDAKAWGGVFSNKNPWSLA